MALLRQLRNATLPEWLELGVVLVVIGFALCWCGWPYLVRLVPPTWDVRCTDAAGAVVFEGPVYTADPPHGTRLGRQDYWTLQNDRQEWVYITGTCIKSPRRAP